MATLALFAAGTAVGPAIFGSGIAAIGLTGAAIGGAVGAFAGNFIDRTFLYPALFGGPQSLEGQRIDSLDVQSASEGSPMYFVLGPQNRLAGTVIWMTDLNESSSTQSSGGKGGGGGQSTTTYSYSVSVAIGVCEGPIHGIKRIWADSKIIYEDGVLTSNCDSIAIYDGTQLAPDSLIEAAEGSAVTPAFKKTAYVVLENLQLADWGNRVPNFTFEVQAEDPAIGLDVSTALEQILSRSRLDPSEYDVSGVGSCLRGYKVAGPTDGVRTLEPLLFAFDIGVREQNGQFVFRDRQLEPTLRVDSTHLGASTDESENPRVNFTDRADSAMYDEVHLTFRDVENDYLDGGLRVARATGDARGVNSIDLPIVMNAVEANAIAARELWRIWQERQECAFEGSPKLLSLTEEDVVLVQDETGEAHEVRLQEVNRGNNHLVECRGVIQDQISRNQIGVADVVIEPESEGPYLPSAVTLYVLDIPGLLDSQLSSPGVYVAAVATSPSADWRSSTIWESGDDENFNVFGSAPVENVAGEATEALAAPQSTATWDRNSTVVVELLNGELESVSEAQVLASRNIAVLGDEIIGFANATLIAPRTYRLSNLLRGLRATDPSGHSIGDRFVLLDNNINFIDLNQGELSTAPRFFRGVMSGGDVATASSTQQALTGSNVRPFAPVHVKASRDGSNNLTVNWIRRSRSLARIFSEFQMPFEEQVEQYIVEFLDGGTVVRTKTVNSATEVTYTASEQTTDGLTPGDPVDLKIYQSSVWLGRGTPFEGTV